MAGLRLLSKLCELLGEDCLGQHVMRVGTGCSRGPIL